MQIETRKQGQVNIVELSGKFSLGPDVEAFHKTINDLLNQGEKKFLIDLSRVPSIDSSGIGTLVRCFESICIYGGEWTLLSPSKSVRNVLTLVRLTSVFEIYEEEQTAIASFPT